MEESGNTKAIQPDTPKTSSFRLELPPCCNSTWAAVDVSLSSAQCPIPFPLGTSSWLGTCTVADGTAKFSFQPDQLPGGVCNRARQTLELAYGKWEPPLVPASEALVTLRPLWKAHCPAQVSCRLLPAEGATSSHPQEWMSFILPPPPKGRIWAPAEEQQQPHQTPRTTGTNPWKRGQGELPEHNTGRITALKVIFTYSALPSPEELALGTAAGSCSNKPGARLQKGF